MRLLNPKMPLVLAPLVLAVLLLSACSRVGGARDEFHPEGAPPVVVEPREVAEAMITARDVDRHVAFLADDSRRGRGTPSEGLERAAAWIAEEFQLAGLEPAGDSGGYLQYWSYAAGPGEDPVQVPNVVGFLPGADLTRAAEYVLVVAHYDHLGVGEAVDGDSIYNGADDNASGVAALVEVVQAFGAFPDPPPRPVAFLAVSGNEDGLLGSTWFAEHPTLRLENAVAVLNLDMVGRNRRDSIGVVGYGYSELGPLVRDVADAHDALGLHVAPADDGQFQEGDQWPFARLGIPAVHFFAGSHEDHQTPSDESGSVDVDKVAAVARLAFFTAHRLASGEITPEWTAAGRKVVSRPD